MPRPLAQSASFAFSDHYTTAFALALLLICTNANLAKGDAVGDLIEQLKAKNAPQKEASPADPKAGGSSVATANSNQAVLDRLDHLEHQITDMNDRLHRMENSMTGDKSD